MAVDTRQKRQSALGAAAVPFVATFPLADGNIANQADRQDAAFSYTGILAESPSVADVTKIFTLFASKQSFTLHETLAVFTVFEQPKVFTARTD